MKKEENVFGARHTFWNQLKLFWSEEKVAAWEAELFPNGLSTFGADSPGKLMTLSKEAHSQWNRGAFALKPVASDPTTLTVQFYWQSKGNDVTENMSLLTRPIPTYDLKENTTATSHGISRLFDMREEESRQIVSGDTFILKTDDPINRPLPSYRLLELQWSLTRVAGMAGAASPEEEGWSANDSDADVPGFVLDEVGDVSGSDLIIESPQLSHPPLLSTEEFKHRTEEEGVENVVRRIVQ